MTDRPSRVDGLDESTQHADCRQALAGIDVAVAASKRLPVCVCVREGGRLVPLPPARATTGPPRGIGNAAAHLRAVEAEYGVTIRCVALDAPRGPAPDGRRRLSDLGWGVRGAPFFVAPDAAGWERARSQVRLHLAGGGSPARLPHAGPAAARRPPVDARRLRPLRPAAA